MTETAVHDAMTTPMLTLTADTPVADAARAMREAEIKSLVIVSEGCQPAGIFTSADALSVLADDTAADDVAVEAYMTTPVETIAPESSLSSAAERMLDGGYSHLPVTDSDGDGLGILTKTDVVAAVSESTLADVSAPESA